MKKAIRFALILIILIIVAVLILGLFAPADVVITRSTVIKAPRAAVLDKVIHFKQWPAWSPWHDKDTAMTLRYIGEDGKPGSGYHWAGDEKIVGEGEIINTGVSNEGMTMTIDIIKPFGMHMTSSFNTVDTAGMTKVTWSMTKHTAYPFNATNLFLNMDKYMGGDFEYGLAKLKKVLEGASVASVPAAIDIREVDFQTRIYAGMRQEVSWEDMDQFFSETYGPLGKAVGGSISGPAVAIYYKWDTVNRKAEIMAAFPVRDSAAKLKGISYAAVPACKAYHAVLRGGYSSSQQYHDALGKHIATNGRQMLLPIEEYAVGMQQEADTAKWITNIYYLLK